ncbi:MAG: PKD domain-containing protein [Gemmatimonadota bacterium]|nr:MAG: PKD domain-containing protein [Gemmatimonadota bacterium]
MSIEIVGGTPIAGFTGSPLIGCVPLRVDFTDQSSMSPTSWSWSFGDEDSSSQEHPSHTYSFPGTYEVTLSVRNVCGSDDEIKNNYITVGAAPVAGFSGSPTEGCMPLRVDFIDESSGNVTGWSWSFGDGDSSAQQNPSHTYDSLGTYTVTLIASNTCGSDEESAPAFIVVSSCAIRGDVNSDGDVDLLDIITTANHILGIVTLEGDALWAADCNGDGDIDLLDLIRIANVILGLGSCAPVD